MSYDGFFGPAKPFGVMTVSWAQLKLYCWLRYRLCIWLLNNFFRFSLINDNMQNILSESSHSTIKCDYVMCTTHVSMGPKSSKVPSCVGWISVAPIFGEQPDLGTPRRSYSWLRGSMMRIVNIETSNIFLLLHLWCFNFKVLSGMIGFIVNVSLTKANSCLLYTSPSPRD